MAGRLLCLIMLVVAAIVSFILAPRIGYILLKAFPGITFGEKTKLFLTTSILACAYPLSSVIYKVWYAEQIGWLANLVQIGVTFLMVFGVHYVQETGKENKLFYTIIAFLGPASIVPFLILIIQLIRSDLSIIFSPELNRMYSIILKRAIGFNIFSILAALTLNLDYLVLSQVADSKSLFEYSLINKTISLVLTIFGTFLSAVWPKVSENAARQSWVEVKRDLHKAILYGFILVTLMMVLSPWALPNVLKFLAPNNCIIISSWLILVIGFYQFLRIWTDSFAMVLHSISSLKVFLIVVPIQAIISIVSQILLVPKLGLIGVYLALIVSFLTTASWFLPVHTYKIINNRLKTV